MGMLELSYLPQVAAEDTRRVLLEQIDLEIELKLLVARNTETRLNYASLLYNTLCENEADPGSPFHFI